MSTLYSLYYWLWRHFWIVVIVHLGFIATPFWFIFAHSLFAALLTWILLFGILGCVVVFVLTRGTMKQ